MASVSLDSTWEETLKKIEESGYFSEDTFHTWIEKTNLFRITDNTALITYRSIVTRNILSKPDATAVIRDTLGEVLGSDIEIELIEYKRALTMLPEMDLDNRTQNLVRTEFNPEYTFENFVQGHSNAEAYAACMACCNQPGSVFNPLLIYGNSGLGKTHLLHAIGNYLKKEKPEARVFYTYSGDLVTILLDAMKTKNIHGNTVDKVKSQLISYDYFLIDDIQNLQQSSSQEVFFTVYNALLAKNAQIVITSDIHPNELTGLQSRLISRFTSGLSVNISKPEFETSKAILKKKIEGNEETLNISEDVLDYLANKFSNDVRNLEGSLTKLIFNATLENADVIDLDFAQRILMKEPVVTTPSQLNIKKIKKVVTRMYGFSYKDIEGKARQKRLANARHIIVYLSREMLHKPYVAIGQELGNRDHTTISSSYERACQLIDNDKEFKMAVEKVKQLLEKE
ncbi:MAG: chromosomal replication initiator protein DnaA [Faecalicoccus sp.]|nr:chromosomal replication initiator protein DnaA [Faecalicoccus sp.]